MDYKEHVGKFIERAAVIDHFLTGLILFRFTPSYLGEGKKLGEEFIDYFVRDSENGMTFGRKIQVFTLIANEHYSELIAKYPKLTKDSLKLIASHRNILAHSFLTGENNPSDELSKRKYFHITSLNPSWKDGTFYLYFNKCTDMEKLVNATVLELDAFYKEALKK